MMWLSENRKSKNEKYISGTISLEGEKYGVVGFTEYRGTVLFAPGGYFWKPMLGDRVLAIKSDETDIVGKMCESVDIEPGEVCIRSAGGAEIRLGNDGNIYLRGNIIEESK